MNKTPCTSENTEATALPANVCVFGRFGQLSPAAFHSADCWFDSGRKCWVHVSCIINYLRKNSFLLRWNSREQGSESSTRYCFWSTVSKRGTHFEHNFIIDKYSCKMVNTLLSGVFNFSAISHNFNLRSAKRSLWTTAKFVPYWISLLFCCNTMVSSWIFERYTFLQKQ